MEEPTHMYIACASPTCAAVYVASIESYKEELAAVGWGTSPSNPNLMLCARCRAEDT